ncbi:MAG: ATP-dependent RecD-like DNA helicase [Lachnospiraceae bacterium]|nr:ATP-dependent RecD-like DNA helicase [Lachnospiraceae bacterium]
MEQITGYIDHVIYKNPENEYTVLLLIREDQEESVCVGIFPGIDQGMTIEAEGEYTEHPTYGKQFRAKSFREVRPKDIFGIERYLGSGAIKGVGEALARRIVKAFGEDTFRVIEDEPEKLSEIKGISPRMAQEIGAQVYEKKAVRDAFIYLQQYGIGNTLAVRIYERYGDGVYAVLRENPYRLAEDVSGVGFRIADDIARKMGIEASSEYRIRSAILYTLSLAAAEGHTCLPADLLVRNCLSILNIEDTDLRPMIEDLAMDRKIVIKKDLIYSAPFYTAEGDCAAMLHELNISMDEEELKKRSEKIREDLDGILKHQNIELDELQEKAVLECIRHGVLVISGGPGTGKTTTINTIIRYYDRLGLEIALAAPTGRAAKRMQEATGYEAKTIHRLLEVSGSPDRSDTSVMFEKNEDNPIDADVVIIDEMSMVDIFLLRSLLKAITVGTRLVLVGDVDQLPSVGPGRVLRDIINSGCFTVVMLKRIFRQEDTGDIVVNAHLINEGKHIRLDNKSRDFFFLERSDPNVIYKHMVELIRDKLPSYVDAKPYDIQVLTPTRKGLLGAPVLNRVLQEQLNPPSPRKKELIHGERIFRTGDKVMQTKNDYQLAWRIEGNFSIVIDEGLGVFNGDTGTIVSIDPAGTMLTVEFDEHKKVDYPVSLLEELEHAYAVTVHKSQGSEYPAVVIPLLSGPRLLMNRNLLYTAVTRAKKCVTILGSSEVLNRMIDNDHEYERYSTLDRRIRELSDI